MAKSRTISKDKSNRKYYDQMNIRIRKDGGDGITSDEIREIAAICGESVNGFVLKSVKTRIDQMKDAD